MLTVIDGVRDGVAVSEGVMLGVKLGVAVSLGVAVGVELTLIVLDTELVLVGDGEGHAQQGVPPYAPPSKHP